MVGNVLFDMMHNTPFHAVKNLFFFIAFDHCSSPFLSLNWPEIALVDLGFKIAISVLAFVPVYRLVLGWTTRSQGNDQVAFRREN